MARCLYCGSEYMSSAKHCPSCGRPVEAVVPGKCPKCGAINALDMVICGNCGGPLPDVSADVLAEAQRSARCRWCGKPAVPGTDQCWECAKRLGDSTLGSIEKKADGLLLVGAILLAVAGVLSIVQGVVSMVLGSALVELGYPDMGGMAFCGLLGVLFGAMAVAGAYFASKRTGYLLVVAGAVLGMLGLGFLVGCVLALIALALIISNRQDFG